MRQFLIVEDDVYLADLLCEVCEDLCDAEALLSKGKSVEAVLQYERPDLAIVDAVLEEKLGLDIICQVATRHKVPGVLISGYDEADIWCQQLGLKHLKKPFRVQSLVEVTRTILADPEAYVRHVQEICALVEATRCRRELRLRRDQEQQVVNLLRLRNMSYFA